MLFAPIFFFFLPDSPNTASFLTEEEKTESIERLQIIDRSGTTNIVWKQLFAGLTDYKNYVHAAMHFSCNYSFAGLSNFLPTLVNGMGFSSQNSQGVTSPVYLGSFFLCVLGAWLSDRFSMRGYLICAFAAIGTAGYLILAIVESESMVMARYAGVWLAACGVFPALSLNITWLLNNQCGDTKKGAGVAILLTIGQCSSFASSALYPDTDA